tara:strand:+ start:207 stop:719 length:513 start_codon:yes stop_codon:yes gene_type:complete
MLFNIIFLILISFFSFITIINYNPDSNILWLITTFISLIYYIGDSLREIYIFKRYTFLFHHFITIFIFIYILNFKNYYCFAIFTFIFELTSIIINIRDLLKSKKKLTFKIDTLFLFIYFIIRCIIGPYFVYKNCNNNIQGIFTIFIFLMSYFWSFKWANNLYKKYIKLYK